VSMFDRMTWSDARLKGVAAGDDKSETFVAQARTLFDTCQVLPPSTSTPPHPRLTTALFWT